MFFSSKTLMVVLAVLDSLKLIIPLLVASAYLIYMERKEIAFMQLRIGPNIVGPFGLLQPWADALKLLSKEPIRPAKASRILFAISPIIALFSAAVGWAFVPTGISKNGGAISRSGVGTVALLAACSFSAYATLLAGWASNSKYSILASMRSAAQMISYEIVAGGCVLIAALCSGTLDVGDLVMKSTNLSPTLKIMLIPVTVVYFVASLAETNRHPFDLPEAESELVSGYNVEYSSMPFALFFLGEYLHMIFASALITTFFLGGWLAPFGFNFGPGLLWFSTKTFLCLFCFIWVRAVLPRYRYDQLMDLCWKKMIPFVFIWFTAILWIIVTESKDNDNLERLAQLTDNSLYGHITQL